MVVKPVFLDSHKSSLYTVLYLPKDPGELREFFIFCHPLFEEKKATHRFFVEQGHLLQSDSCGVVFMDLSGCGDSTGDLTDVILDDWLKDLDHLVNHLEQTCDSPDLRLNLMGVRFGAMLAALFSARNPRCDKLILIDPVLNGHDYFQEILKQKLVREMMTFGQSGQSLDTLVNILNSDQLLDLDGVAVNKPFYESIVNAKIDPATLSDNLSILLIQQAARRELSPPYQTFIDQVSQRGIDIGSDCLAVPPFWKAVDVADHHMVATASSNWLGSRSTSSDALQQ